MIVTQLKGDTVWRHVTPLSGTESSYISLGNHPVASGALTIPQNTHVVENIFRIKVGPMSTQAEP